MPYCGKCGSPISLNSNFCGKCGSPVVAKKHSVEITKANFCSKCGSPIKENSRFCGKCGTKLQETKDNDSVKSLVNPNLPMVTEYDESFDKSTIEEVAKAANQGNPVALYELGSRYRLGVDGVEKNETKAIELYKEVLKYQNNREAFYHIGYMLADGVLGEQHEKECLKYYEAACEMGSSRAATQLGILYEHGISYIEQDLERAVDYYDKAIKFGNGNGCERTYKARLLEQLGKDDLAKKCYYETLQYYNNEIQNGKLEDVAWCQGEMGNIYRHLGENLKAKECYELALRSGENPQAATDLGTIFEDGIPGILEPDLEKALYYYQLGYDTKYDDDRAVLNIKMLALFYFQDKAGEDKDYEAFKLFKEIYDMGSKAANAYLGFYYGAGIPGYVEVNTDKAFELLDNVESYDETLALYYKGAIYLNELHDIESAKVFLAKAADRGHQQSKELLAKIGGRSNPLANTLIKVTEMIKDNPMHDELVQQIYKAPNPDMMVNYTKRLMNEGEIGAALTLISGTYHVFKNNLAVIYELITIDDIYLYGTYAIGSPYTESDKNVCDMILDLINFLRTQSFGDPLALSIVESNMYFVLGKYYQERDVDRALKMYAKSNIDYTPRTAVEMFGAHTKDIDRYINELYYDSINLKKSLNSDHWHEDRFKALAYFALETIYVNGAPGVPVDMNYAYWCIEQACQLSPGNSVYEEEKKKFR